MVERIRRTLLTNKGVEVMLVCDEGRNIIREEKAIIKEVYKSLFILEVYKNNNSIQRESFSYADLLTKVVKLCMVDGDLLISAT